MCEFMNAAKKKTGKKRKQGRKIKEGRRMGHAEREGKGRRQKVKGEGGGREKENGGDKMGTGIMG